MINRLRHLSFWFVVTVFSLAACADTPAADTAEAQPPAVAAQALLEPWSSDAAPGVAVAVSLDGETVFASGLGVANLEYDAPITPETIFHAASVSKQFTAFSIMLLASEERLSLDDDIRLYLPELQDRGRSVTIRHLLDHMSGYREVGVLAGMAGWLEDDIRTNEQYIRLIAKQAGENFAPADHIEYSNTGYFLLSQIVERVSGETFHDFTQQHIFEPLGMANTHFSTDRATLIPGHAESYTPGADGFRKFHLISEDTGSTGLKTTALDLLKWAENFTTRTVGNEAVFALMAERTEAADGKPAIFGRGQELRPYKGLETWSHGGRDAGFRSFLMRIPEERFAVSILSNRADFDTAKIAYQIVDTYLAGSANYEEDSATQWEPASASELAALSGTYELYPGILFDISVDGSTLKFAPMGATERAALPQIGENEFVLSPEADLSLVFETDEAGQATAFNYTIGLHGALHAPRIELSPFAPETVNPQDYIGTYYSPELATEYEISLVDGVLTVSHLRMGSAAMTPYQPDTFSAPQGFAQRFQFDRDADGAVTGAHISGALAKEVTFHRVTREY